MAAKLARWLIFTVVFSLIPLVVDFVSEIARTNGALEAANFGRHGELYLLASAMCAVGLGEIIGVSQNWSLPKIMAGGGAAVIIALATALYTISASDAAQALVRGASEHGAANNVFAKNLLGYSGLTWIFACIVSTSCIALSEVK